MRDFLTEEQVKSLKLTHRTIKDKKLADRIKAVLSLNAGFEYSHIAKILLLDEVTLRRYVNNFQEKGIEGLLAYRYTGGKSQLTTIQLQELKSYLVANTQTKAKDIVVHIQKQYDVSYSVIGVTKLLHRMGFAYKRPKIIPGKADRVKQEAFIKQYQEIKSNLRENDQVYFLDSTHPTHNTTVSYGWILKGKANDKFVKTNTGRSRLNLNGALNLRHLQAVVLEEKTINYKSTIKLFKRLLKQHPKGKIYLILDNASHHRHQALKPFLKKHRRLKTIFLPTYSPNLNLIERLWRFFHTKVTNNHYFETFEEFRKTTLKFFRNLDRYRDELQTLLTDNFQLVPNLQLQT
jgi:transposase